MANETFIKGDVNILYLYDTSAYEPVACLTSNSLATTLGVNETATKCDAGNTIKTTGNFEYSISAEGLFIDTGTGGDTTKFSHDTLLELQLAKTLVTWKIDTGLTTNTAYYGTGYITDLTLDSPTNQENATFSMTLGGSGTIATVDPNA